MNLGYTFTITCKKCRCKTELRTKKYEKRRFDPGCFICPNCGEEMPTAAYQSLTTVMDTLSFLPENTDCTMGVGFLIDVDVIKSDWADDPEL